MFGGPALFLIIAIVGLRALLGPIPEPHPVQRLRDGVVSAGASEAEVLKKIGRPHSVAERDGGGFSYRFQRSAWDPGRMTFMEEDAYVDFSSDGRVSSISFESRIPEPSQNEGKSQ